MSLAASLLLRTNAAPAAARLQIRGLLDERRDLRRHSRATGSRSVPTTEHSRSSNRNRNAGDCGEPVSDRSDADVSGHGTSATAASPVTKELALQLELCLPRLLSSPAPWGLDRRTSGFQPESWPQGQTISVLPSGHSCRGQGFFFPIPNHCLILSRMLMHRVYAPRGRCFRRTPKRPPNVSAGSCP